MITLLIAFITVIHLLCGWYAVKLIKKRDPQAPIAVDIIVILHGAISLLTTYVIQNLLCPEEKESKTIFLRDGMTLDMDNEEHVKIYEQLKKINKK